MPTFLEHLGGFAGVYERGCPAGGDDDDPVTGTFCASVSWDVSGAGRHIDDEVIDVPPAVSFTSCSEGCVPWAAPKPSGVSISIEEADRDRTGCRGPHHRLERLPVLDSGPSLMPSIIGLRRSVMSHRSTLRFRLAARAEGIGPP